MESSWNTFISNTNHVSIQGLMGNSMMAGMGNPMMAGMMGDPAAKRARMPLGRAKRRPLTTYGTTMTYETRLEGEDLVVVVCFCFEDSPNEI